MQPHKTSNPTAKAPAPERPGPRGEFGFEQLLAAVKAAIAEASAVPQLLDGVQSRRYVGLSKSAWHRAKSAGLIPAPVYVEGAGNKYRRADLDRFVERLRPRRKLRPAPNARDVTPPILVAALDKLDSLRRLVREGVEGRGDA